MHHKSDLLAHELAGIQAYPDRTIKSSRGNCFQAYTGREGEGHKEFMIPVKNIWLTKSAFYQYLIISLHPVMETITCCF